MSDEIFLGGKQYVSSKKAATLSSYAQDYIGQLARSGAIDAQRVGGLWYVSMDSLAEYQRNAASYTPSVPVSKSSTETDTIVSFDGKDYVSASRAAKITAYNQDYIGQLARSGKILSRQIGNRWYIERGGLLAHKAEKDRLLAAVQAESVGLVRHEAPQGLTEADRAYAGAGPFLTYVREDGDLMPILGAQNENSDETTKYETPRHEQKNSIPIKVLRTMPSPIPKLRPVMHQKSVRASGKTMLRAAEAGVALTFVIVLSYGFVSIKDTSIYTSNIQKGMSIVQSSALTASAAGAFEHLAGMIEEWIVPEIVYKRPQ